jgi:hypothetical protein
VLFDPPAAGLGRESAVLVDLAANDPGRGDAPAVLRGNVRDDDDLERIVPALAADLVDPLAALAGLRRDDEVVESGFGGDPRRLAERPDLELPSVLVGQLLQFHAQSTAALLERADVALLVAGPGCQFVAREADGHVPQLERPLEEGPVAVVHRIERATQRDLHGRAHAPDGNMPSARGQSSSA